MGQRLVVEIKRRKRRLATVYFHWSAYTKPGIEILNSMYFHVLAEADNLSDNELILQLVRFAEKHNSFGICETDEDRQRMQNAVAEKIRQCPPLQSLYESLLLPGGVHPDSLSTLQKLFPDETFLTDVSRNSGLVSIEELDMEDAIKWADGLIEVNLDTKHVVNGLVDEYKIAGYLDASNDFPNGLPDPDDLPRIPITLDEFQLDEIVIVNDVLSIESEASWLRYDDVIYETIR